METLLEVKHLSIAYDQGKREVVKDCSLSLKSQEILGIVGESGSGKSTLVMSIIGLLKKEAMIKEGKILYCGRDITPSILDGECQGVRGGEIAIVMQNAMSSLDPYMKVGSQLIESLRIHTGCKGEKARVRAEEMLDMVGIRDAKKCMNQYPFECSGGMQQRICIAIALAGEPKILIADEPTTALDATVQIQILNLLRRLSRDLKIAVLLVSHDLGVVKMLSNRIMIMHEGRMIEEGSTEEILRSGKEEYTKALICSRKNLEKMSVRREERGMEPVLLRAEQITKGFRGKEILHAVSLEIHRNKIYGLVGESGCGKSTLARTLLGIYPKDEGEIYWGEDRINDQPRKRRKDFSKKIQMIFQNPYQALNPSMTIYENLKEALVTRKNIDKKFFEREIKEILLEVGVDPSRCEDFPGQLSGGQLQRVMIARALLMSPELLVCDEPFTGLDIQIQERLVHLLEGLKEKRKFSMIIISHDLSLMSRISDVLGVMYAGRIQEEGPCGMIAEDPWHPYTKALFLTGEKVKLTSTDKQRMWVQEEYVGSQNEKGCPYAVNCRYAQKKCFSEMPQLYDYGQRKVRCFLYAEEKNMVRADGYRMRSLV